jgi:hypothetical protein
MFLLRWERSEERLRRETPAPEFRTLRVRQLEPRIEDLGSFESVRLRIGKPECEVRLPYAVGISGVHAVLEWKAAKLWITDPGARQPVEIDGAILPYQRPVELRSGARVRLGSVLLVVDYPPLAID